MYTVLIQSQKTLNDFGNFRPLMADSMKNGVVVECRWEESGRTLETALPDLFRLVQDKKEWRAVIICTQPSDGDGPHPASKFNPYDYLENAVEETPDTVQAAPKMKVENGEIVESRVPLIHLTHLLCGIPAPTPEFEAKVVFGEHGDETERPDDRDQIKKVVYVPTWSSEQEKTAYKKWMKEHYLPFVPPKEIYMLYARDVDDALDTYDAVQFSWNRHQEIQSSRFWERNFYPQNCRFMIFDMTHRGEMFHQQELFRFWTIVLLLSLNNVDPDILQANRLYKVGLDMDLDKMKESFENTAIKLNGTRYILEQAIERERRELRASGAEIPDYKLKIKVDFTSVSSTPRLGLPSYGLLKSSDNRDQAEWRDYRSEAMTRIDRMLKSTERILDQAAGTMREESQYRKDDVRQLNEFQQIELEASLDEVYHRLLQDQANLPPSEKDMKKDVEEAEEFVLDRMRRRVTGRQLGYMLVVFIASVLLFLGTGLFTPKADYASVLVMIGSTVLMILLFVFVALFWYKKQFDETIGYFRESLSDLVSRIIDNGSLFSEFFSDVASHIHGKSYMDEVREQEESFTNNFYFKVKHVKEIDGFISQLKQWNTALHLNANLSNVPLDDTVDAESVDTINYERLSELDAGKKFRIPVGKSGSTIMSPYGFIRELHIEREESYDDFN